MVQVENGNKAGNNNDHYKKERERRHQREPQIQLKIASEAIERASGTSETERVSEAAGKASSTLEGLRCS